MFIVSDVPAAGEPAQARNRRRSLYCHIKSPKKSLRAHIGLKSGRGGFTLLEILVAVVILAVGILGVTAMQSASLNGQVLSRQTDSCYNLVSDVIDRMQANSENITDYVDGGYGNSFTITTSTETGQDAGQRPAAAEAGADWDDLYDQMINMGLLNATLTVSLQNDVPITGVDTATSTVVWQHKGAQKQCQIINVITRD